MQRVIKKYPNRRLYDTEQSRYITLADLQKLVLEGVDFVVNDATTGDDITRSILLQIITDQESGGQPLFTTDILMRFIRSYDNSVKDALTAFLDQSMGMFEEQQKAVQERMQSTLSENPVTSIMTEVTQKNLDMWQELQNRFFESAGLVKPKPRDDK